MDIIKKITFSDHRFKAVRLRSISVLHYDTVVSGLHQKTKHYCFIYCKKRYKESKMKAEKRKEKRNADKNTATKMHI